MKSRTAWLWALTTIGAISIAGCGGDGGGSKGSGGGSASNRVAFVPGAGYNGSSAPLDGTTTSIALGTQLSVAIASGGRNLAFTFPKRSFSAGETFTPGSGGTVVSYSDATARSGSPQWLGTGGTITVAAATSSTVRFTFEGIVFSPTHTDGSVQAAGTFSASGGFAGIPNEPSAATNATDIRFSQVDGTDVDTSLFPTDADVSISQAEGTYDVAVIQHVNFLPARQFTFRLPLAVAAGTTLSITPTGANGAARGYYFQLSPSLDYRADSGSVTVVSKTDSKFELRFSNVHLRSMNSNASFVVNGSVQRA